MTEYFREFCWLFSQFEQTPYTKYTMHRPQLHKYLPFGVLRVKHCDFVASWPDRGGLDRRGDLDVYCECYKKAFGCRFTLLSVNWNTGTGPKQYLLLPSY